VTEVVRNLFGVVPSGPDVIQIGTTEEEEEDDGPVAVRIATAADRKMIERMKKNYGKFSSDSRCASVQNR